MGGQLWTSPVTGYRRIGTRFSDVRDLFDKGITVLSIFEPLKSCQIDANAFDMQVLLDKRDYDVAGVMDSEDSPIVGFVYKSDLKSGTVREHLKIIETDRLISDSTPIPELFSLFSHNEFLFVLNKTKVEGIVTRADLNKPPVRIYLFGIVSLLEMHLSFWVKENYKEKSWEDKISSSRLKKAKDLYRIRKENNQDIGLFECLQIADKCNLFLGVEALLRMFSIKSKTEGKKIFRHAEELRNSLAHSQVDISEGVGWKRLFSTIEWIEGFISLSDSEIELIARKHAKYFNDELWNIG